MITADIVSNLRVIMATAGPDLAVGGAPTVAIYPTSPAPMQEPPRPVSSAAVASQVLIDFAVTYQLYSPAYQATLTSLAVWDNLAAMVGALVEWTLIDGSSVEE